MSKNTLYSNGAYLCIGRMVGVLSGCDLAMSAPSSSPARTLCFFSAPHCTLVESLPTSTTEHSRSSPMVLHPHSLLTPLSRSSPTARCTISLSKSSLLRAHTPTACRAGPYPHRGPCPAVLVSDRSQAPRVYGEAELCNFSRRHRRDGGARRGPEHHSLKVGTWPPIPTLAPAVLLVP